MSLEAPIILLILATPIYFFSKWILKILKFGDNTSRKYLALILAAVLSFTLYVTIGLILIYSIFYYPEIPFNQQEWSKNTEERYKMSSDIIKSEMLIGKTKAEVIELLGEEDFYSGDDKDENHMIYYLGYVPGIASIDPDILEIFFEDGKVVAVSQRGT